ncbi:hypothetical protein P12x_006054 (plasmid) [Tundrisphaera lichenicola]|uniref:hypothetical protein n=1 Tax=Tundrisphaera lichenicola TaxID=2029860 RepID=UPI003EBE305F
MKDTQSYAIIEIDLNHNREVEITGWLVDATTLAGSDAVQLRRRTLELSRLRIGTMEAAV